MLFVQLHVLFADHEVQQLLAQTLKGDNEVDDLDFGSELRQVVGVGCPRRHVELELVSIVDVGVSELNLLDPSHFEDLLEQYRV